MESRLLMGRVIEVVFYFVFAGLFLVSLATLVRGFYRDVQEFDVADELRQTWEERTGHK
jgi:hypothetical protein